ncbi:hypothetical protein [Pedosphaera parvula]|uniref:hypothetical protein n=1 Tax=Pedosphaera parvula TaxID=1032527 RepID=UPI0012379E61|nr:hypothetical protein [Pedosphaera parvula]
MQAGFDELKRIALTFDRAHGGLIARACVPKLKRFTRLTPFASREPEKPPVLDIVILFQSHSPLARPSYSHSECSSFSAAKNFFLGLSCIGLSAKMVGQN